MGTSWFLHVNLWISAHRFCVIPASESDSVFWSSHTGSAGPDRASQPDQAGDRSQAGDGEEGRSDRCDRWGQSGGARDTSTADGPEGELLPAGGEALRWGKLHRGGKWIDWLTDMSRDTKHTTTKTSYPTYPYSGEALGPVRLLSPCI